LLDSLLQETLVTPDFTCVTANVRVTVNNGLLVIEWKVT